MSFVRDAARTCNEVPAAGALAAAHERIECLVAERGMRHRPRACRCVVMQEWPVACAGVREARAVRQLGDPAVLGPNLAWLSGGRSSRTRCLYSEG
jgi:hypothetical protein